MSGRKTRAWHFVSICSVPCGQQGQACVVSRVYACYSSMFYVHVVCMCVSQVAGGDRIPALHLRKRRMVIGMCAV